MSSLFGVIRRGMFHSPGKTAVTLEQLHDVASHIVSRVLPQS